MDRAIEFITNHYLLVAAFALLGGWFLFTEFRRGGATLTPQGAVGLINRKQAVVVDLRKQDEFRKGHIADSINVPFDDMDNNLPELRKHTDKPLILVCDSGSRTGAAGRHLRGKGIDNLWRISGGLNSWQQEKLPVVTS